MKISMTFGLLLAASLLPACSSTPKKTEPAPSPATATTPAAKPGNPAAPAAAAKSAVAASATKAPTPAGALSCEQGSDKRTVVVEKSEKSRCEVHYTKFGKSEMVASSDHGPGFCDEVKDRIRAHLEASQFTCK